MKLRVIAEPNSQFSATGRGPIPTSTCSGTTSSSQLNSQSWQKMTDFFSSGLSFYWVSKFIDSVQGVMGSRGAAREEMV